MRLIKHYDFVNMKELHKDFNIETGDKWHNEELQEYHSDDSHVYLDNGLILQATYENGVISSGRINTRTNFSFTYGKIDVIAKLPNGKGTWPAVWMMPSESIYGHWPKSGEIDIMEYSGNHPEELVYALHTESHNHKTKNEYVTRINYPSINQDFHKFSIKWESDKIIYYLDDVEVVTYEKGKDGKDPSVKGWPFIEDFYLILNLAIGGWMGGKVDYDSFPQQFIIKDIKIFQ